MPSRAQTIRPMRGMGMLRTMEVSRPRFQVAFGRNILALDSGPERGTIAAMNPIFKLIVKGHVWLYRSSGGKRGKTIAGMPVLLLTTRGRKSGAQRTVPVVPFVDAGETYVIASMGGQPQHPAWYFNLQADPKVDVQFGSDQYRARAEV